MLGESSNNNFLIIVSLYLLFVVIILIVSVIFDFFGHLAAEEILNIVEHLNVE